MGLKGLEANKLRSLGYEVPAEAVDSHGRAYPRCTTVPMGWGPAPGLAQGAHEAILYGRKGEGSERAQALEPVLDPAARWSGLRTPAESSAAAAAPHTIVVDDVLLFKQVERATYTADGVASLAEPAESGDVGSAEARAADQAGGDGPDVARR